MDGGTIKVAAALIRDDLGQVLAMRKRGPRPRLMQLAEERLPPAKTHIAALLIASIAAELGCGAASRSRSGCSARLDAIAANELPLSGAGVPAWNRRHRRYHAEVARSTR